MNLLQDGIVAMLASIGLIAVVWLIAGAVMRLGCRPSMPAWILLPAQGSAPQLQQTVRELDRVRQELTTCPPIVILDRGLSEDGRRTAELLAEERYLVRLMGPEEFQID